MIHQLFRAMNLKCRGPFCVKKQREHLILEMRFASVTIGACEIARFFRPFRNTKKKKQTAKFTAPFIFRQWLGPHNWIPSLVTRGHTWSGCYATAGAPLLRSLCVSEKRWTFARPLVLPFANFWYYLAAFPNFWLFFAKFWYLLTSKNSRNTRI